MSPASEKTPSRLAWTALAAALALLLTACSAFEAEQEAPPPEPQVPPSSAEPLAVPPSDLPSDTAAEPLQIPIEESEGERSGTEDRAKDREAAVQSCYEFATAQIAKDQAIDSDISNRSANRGVGSDVVTFQRSLDKYGYEQRRRSLYESCMSSKGFER